MLSADYKPLVFEPIIGSISCYRGLTTTEGTVGDRHSDDQRGYYPSIMVISLRLFPRLRSISRCRYDLAIIVKATTTDRRKRWKSKEELEPTEFGGCG